MLANDEHSTDAREDLHSVIPDYLYYPSSELPSETEQSSLGWTSLYIIVNL